MCVCVCERGGGGRAERGSVYPCEKMNIFNYLHLLPFLSKDIPRADGTATPEALIDLTCDSPENRYIRYNDIMITPPVLACQPASDNRQ